MLPTDPIPGAARLGPTYTGWECERCGVVAADEVVVLDDGDAWHDNWGLCGGACRPVALLIRDPRQWANEGTARLQALATEVLRLREALALIAETAAPPARYQRWAKQALRGEPIAADHHKPPTR